MRVYISGKITGLDPGEAMRNFCDAQSLLESMGMETVNPMAIGVTRGAELTWEQHMVMDFELLLCCEAIYLQKNWNDSRGSRIEKRVAEVLELKVLFESGIANEHRKIQQIWDAIQEVTTMTFDKYAARSRKRDVYFARMIFIHLCAIHAGLTRSAIADLVGQDETTVARSLKSYHTEAQYNPKFRALAKSVDDALFTIKANLK